MAIIAVLDFGSQYTQVIARRIREIEVLTRIYHFTTPAAKLADENVSGVILSGGPASVTAEDAPRPGDFQPWRPGTGHLLRASVDVHHAWRCGETQRSARIWSRDA